MPKLEFTHARLPGRGCQNVPGWPSEERRLHALDHGAACKLGQRLGSEAFAQQQPIRLPTPLNPTRSLRATLMARETNPCRSGAGGEGRREAAAEAMPKRWPWAPLGGRTGHWARSHCLRSSSLPPPKSSILPPSALQAREEEEAQEAPEDRKEDLARRDGATGGHLHRSMWSNMVAASST